MKTRNAEFDARWNNDCTLKENIINLFNMDFVCPVNIEITGLFYRKQDEEKKVYNDFKNYLLVILADDKKTSLEELYVYFRIVLDVKSKAWSGQLGRMLAYVVERMEQIVPELKSDKDLQSKIKNLESPYITVQRVNTQSV